MRSTSFMLVAMLVMSDAVSGVALARPVSPSVDWQTVPAEAVCAYCEDYRDQPATVSTAWKAAWGYELAREIKPVEFVAETGCAYCGDYAEAATAEVVASSWRPGTGYAPLRTARASWWFW